MTIVEMIKKMGGSDERMSRAKWGDRAWVTVDHDSGRMFLSIVNAIYDTPWIPSCYDLIADDWQYWTILEEPIG